MAAGHRFGYFCSIARRLSSESPANMLTPSMPLADIANDVHCSHRACCADDIDFVAFADFAGFGDMFHRVGGFVADGAGDSDAGVMDPADGNDDVSAESFAAQDDIEKTLRADLGEKRFDPVGIAAEVNHVVETRRRAGGRFRGKSP